MFQNIKVHRVASKVHLNRASTCMQDAHNVVTQISASLCKYCTLLRKGKIAQLTYVCQSERSNLLQYVAKSRNQFLCEETLLRFRQLFSDVSFQRGKIYAKNF